MSGGGIAVAEGNALSIDASTIADNTVTRSAAGVARGGGIAITGSLDMTNTTVSGNSVSATGGGTAIGGGLYVDDDGEGAAVTASTFAANTAGGAGNGIHAALSGKTSIAGDDRRRRLRAATN